MATNETSQECETIKLRVSIIGLIIGLVNGHGVSHGVSHGAGYEVSHWVGQWVGLVMSPPSLGIKLPSKKSCRNKMKKTKINPTLFAMEVPTSMGSVAFIRACLNQDFTFSN